jgi:hypothetical protein
LDATRKISRLCCWREVSGRVVGGQQQVVWRFVVNAGDIDRIEELGNVLVDVMDRFGSEALSTLSYRSYSDVFCLFIIS